MLTIKLLELTFSLIVPSAADLCKQIGPDLDPNCLTLIVFLQEFSKQLNLGKNQKRTKKDTNLPSK